MNRLREIVARFTAALTVLRARWLGYDIFISYTHRDAKGYAEDLQHRLEDEEGFVCFRDATELVAGEMLDERIERALAKSRMLVALGTPGSRDSDYMVKEIETFESERPMIGVDFEGSIPLDLWPVLRERIRLPESLAALGSGRPSDATIEGIRKAVRFRRRRTLAQIIISLFVVLVVLLASGVILGLRTAKMEQLEQDRQRQIAIARGLAQEARRQEGALAVLLAAQAWRLNEEARGAAGQDIDEALRGALKSNQTSKELALPKGVVGEPIYLDPTSTWALLRGEDAVYTLRREGHRMTLHDDERADDLGRSTADAVIRQSADGRIVRKVPADGREQAVEIGGSNEITFITASDDKRTVVVLTSDGGVHLVRFGATPEVTQIHAFEAFESEGFFPEDSYIDVAVARSGSRVAVAELIDWDRLKVLAWEVSQAAEIGQPQVLYDDYVEVPGEIYLDPRGRYLVLTTPAIEGFGSASVWDLEGPSIGPSVFLGHGEYFQAVTFNQDGTWLALGTGSYGVDGIPQQTGIEVANLELLFDPEGADRAISSLPCDKDGIDLLRFSDDGERLLSTDGTLLRVWQRVGIGFQPKRIWRHEDVIISATWVEDGRAVLSVTEGGVFRQWDLEPPPAQPRALRGSEYSDESTRTSVAFSPDGRQVAAGGYDEVGIWDLDATDLPQTIAGDSGYVTALDFSPTGAILVGGHEDGSLLTWQSDAPGPLTVLGQHQQGDVNSLVVLPSGDHVLSGGADGTVRVWALDGSGTGWLVDDPGQEVTSVAAQADGSMVAWSFGKTVRLGPWKEPVSPVEELSYEAKVTVVVFARDALLVGLHDGSVLRESLVGQRERTGLGRHRFPIEAATTDPQGRWLATGDSAGEVRLWDLVNGGPLAVLSESNRPVTGLDFDPAGHWLASSSFMIYDGGDGELDGHLWLRPTTTGLMRLAEGRVWRNLSCVEWMEYVGPEVPYRRTFDSLPFPDDLLLCNNVD